jgi:tRNA-specific 2-thiouridylase
MKVLVGMSGGVDSSVAAALLLEQGHDVTGGFIKNWSDTVDLWTGECAWRAERRDALRVAAKLGISLLTFDFEKQYRERVLGRMFAGYADGETPNPDVLCNQEIKFGLFFEAARALGFEAIATGHYAQVTVDAEGTAHLLKGVDPAKDQSYFLYRVPQEALKHSLFPVGHLPKPEVRVLAERFGLPTAQKPDSQGICFVGKLDFHEFLRKKIPPTPGEIVTSEGRVIGTHDGLDAYTIGQRQGLLVSEGQTAWYVAAKDRAQNRLVVVPDREHPLLYRERAQLQGTTWCRGVAPVREGEVVKVEVMARYHQAPVSAELRLEAGKWMLQFAQPVWALATGQSAVLYQGEECLGGGFFAET